MELVSKTPFLYNASKYFKGCILVFEYSYFLLQNNDSTIRNVLDLAVEEYQKSGTQATILDALQHAIDRNGGDHDTLQKVILDVILNNRMCKLIFLMAI